MQQGQRPFVTQFENRSIIGGSARVGIAIEITLRVQDHASDGIGSVGRSPGEVVQHSLFTLRTHLPHGSLAAGTASAGCAIEIPLLVHCRSSVGIAPVLGSSGEAVQHGQLVACTQLVQHSEVLSTAIRGHAIKVAFRVQGQGSVERI